ncbi:glycosyltransferase [Algiphilus aromaticivorans]|uniref:glycosyltransferase n=1 Tax=Algiphilus aromaticivorans TaxID=382454 RepID=UPI0009FBDBD5|nr:glycosyltransferase [Algiphilus aromaticivorans]
MGRIAVVFPRLIIGGQERMRLQLARVWREHGFDVDIVVGWAQGDVRHLVPKDCQLFEVARFGRILFPFGLLWYFITRKPSHVVCAGYDAVTVCLLMWRFLRFKAPLLVSIHSHTSIALRARLGFKGRIVEPLFRWLIRDAARHVRGVIAVSNGVAEDLIMIAPMLAEKVHIVPNPVVSMETARLSREACNNVPVRAGVPWIVFVGRLVPVKNVRLLIAAFSKLPKSKPVELVIVGEGAELPHLQCEVSTRKLCHRVHFVGVQNNPLPWMREASLLVLPSSYEGFGNVLVEAMACGTQVVAADCPSGPREILAGGKYGQLFPVGDVAALTEAIQQSLDRRFRVAPEHLIARAANYSSDSVGRRYLDILGVWNRIN